ncbi:MAG: SirB2 family protein [Wenzhouxiangella sp.]|nr:SirB2 family protein [Wenzhouxiangella sp.]
MSIYMLLKHLHVLLVVASGLGFAVRGYYRILRNRPLLHPMVRFGPHIIDTLLLFSGVALWFLVPYPLMSWFGLKLGLVLGYIVLGICAFRSSTDRRATASVLFALALLVFIGIVMLAVFKPTL